VPQSVTDRYMNRARGWVSPELCVPSQGLEVRVAVENRYVVPDRDGGDEAPHASSCGYSGSRASRSETLFMQYRCAMSGRPSGWFQRFPSGCG
jgi:hypothetical protein